MKKLLSILSLLAVFACETAPAYAVPPENKSFTDDLECFSKEVLETYLNEGGNIAATGILNSKVLMLILEDDNGFSIYAMIPNGTTCHILSGVDLRFNRSDIETWETEN